jgi:hypothetical protein
MKKTMLSIAVCCVAAARLHAEIAPPSDVVSRARGAARVVVARVIDVHAQFETNRFGDQLIVSNALLDVIETLKGEPAATLRVVVEGGTVGDLTLKVSDMPAMRAGDRAVFFLDDAGAGPHIPHDRGRGVMRLAPNDRIERSTLTLDDVRQQVRAALGQGVR